VSLPIRRTPEQERAFWRERLHEEVRLKRLQLPTLPEVTQKLRQAVSDNATPVRTLAQVIGTEPALSARISQAANAAWLGREPTASLETAITRLGYNAVRGMVYNHCLARLFRERQTGPLRDELRKIWHRASLTGAYGQRLSLMLGIENSHALLAGLVHNIGALPVFALFAQQKELAGKLDLMRALIAGEQGVIGELILRQWQVPEELYAIPVAAFQDAPERPTQVIDLTRIARELAQWYELPNSTVPQIEQLPAMKRLRLSLVRLESFLQESRDEITELNQMLQG
jgi:HD-like signal output (HDOD) protein